MSVKPSPPPVTGLYHRRHTEPVLIMRGSDTTPQSKCLVLAWPDSKPAHENRGGMFKSGVAIAEKRNNHTSLVVSPSGQRMVKVQSSYQGFFTPEKFYPHSPGRTPPSGGFTMTSTPQQRRARDEEKTGSFFSFSNSPSPARPQTALTTPSYRHAGPGVSSLVSSSRDIVLPSSEKRVRFRGDASIEHSPAAAGGSGSSPGLLGDGGSFEDMSTSSVNSIENSRDWHHSWSHESDHHAYWSKSSQLGGLCQRLCWWFATCLVVLILCFNLSFIYFDYQASIVKLTPSQHQPLKAYLAQYLVSQPIAIGEISSTLDSFLLPDDNQSTVVLSFHGGAGVGKSFTSDLIQEYYFGHADAHPCVSTFSVPMYASYETAAVRGKLEEWLRNREGTCHLRLFILEDLHGYTPCRIVSLIRRTLESFLAQEAKSKQAVIITTNIAAIRIKQDALYNLETNVKGNLNPYKFRSAIQRSWEAVDEFKMNDGSLEGSDQLAEQEVSCDFRSLSELINVTIPFLPLGRRDVEECVANIASGRGLQVLQEQREWVADQLTYEPSHWPVYSSSGCKLVAEKFGLIQNVGQI